MLITDSKPSPRLWWIGAGVGVLTCGLILYWGVKTAYPLFAYDDAFISYQYAQNLRNGVGLVYNPGDWVLGTTAPLYTLVLAFLSLLDANIEVLAHWVSVASWMVASVVVLVILWHEGNPRSGMVAAILLALQHNFISALGMETSTVTAVMLITAWAFLGRHKRLVIVFGALALLLRYDTALWLIILGLEMWRRNKRPPWREALGILIIVLPWFVFAFLRYGVIMPTSAMAKIDQNVYMQVGETTQSFMEDFLAQLTNGGSLVVILAWLLSFACGIWSIFRRRYGFTWIVVWTVVYLLVYSCLGVSPAPWYMIPPLIALILVSSLGIGRLFGDAVITGSETKVVETRPTQARSRAGIKRFTVGVIGVLMGLGLMLSSGLAASNAIDVHGNPKWDEYYQVAQWLRDNAPERSTVAATEIGIIGYYSNRIILDTMGLISTDVTRHLTGWTDTLVYVITTHWPDYIVVLPGTAWDNISGQWWFTKYYSPVATFSPNAGNHWSSVIYSLVNRPIGGYTATAHVEYVTGIVLESVDVERQQIQPGEALDLWLQFLVTRRVPVDYQLTVSLVDNQSGEQWATTSVWPYNDLNSYPTSHWLNDEIRRVPVRLVVPEELPAGTYRIGILIYDPQQNRTVPTMVNPNSDYTQVQLGYLRVGDPPEPLAITDLRTIRMDAEWEIGVQLNTIGLPSVALVPGDVLPVQIEWQTNKKLEEEATVFLHLVDKQGRIVTQLDQPPFGGRFPLPVWRPGEVMRDEYLLSLPSDLAPGSYTLRVGLYTPNGRLALSSRSAGSDSEDYVAVPVQIGIIPDN